MKHITQKRAVLHYVLILLVFSICVCVYKYTFIKCEYMNFTIDSDWFYVFYV